MLLALQALLFLAPLVMGPGLFEPANLPQTVFVQVASGALLAFAFTSGVRVLPPWRVAPFGRPWALLVAWGLLSLFWAHTFREAWPEGLPWVSVVVVFAVAAGAATGEAAGRRLLGAVFASGVIVTGLGLLQFYFHVDWVPQAFPPAATFMNRNVAVSFVVAACPLGVAVAGTRGSGRAWAVAMGCGLMGVFVFHTFTKSGWLALVVQGVLGIALVTQRNVADSPTAGMTGSFPSLADSLSPPAAQSPEAPGGLRGPQQRAGGLRVWWAGVAIAVLVMFALAQVTGDGFRPRWREATDAVAFAWTAPLTGPDRPLAQLTTDDRANSIRSRRAIWSNTLVMVREHPLPGVGLGNHKVHYGAYARRAVVDSGFGPAQLDYVHDEPLQLLAELGLVGLALGGWLAMAVVRVLWRAHRAGRHPTLVLAITLSLAGLATDALFNFPFQRAIPPVVAAVELAVLAVLLETSPETEARPRRGLALLALVATLMVAFQQARVLAADRHVLVARQAEARHDWPQAERFAVRALLCDPGRKEALFVRGRALLEQGDLRAASAVLQRLLAAYPYDVGALGNLAAAERAQGHAREARAALGQLLTLWPEDARAQAALARELEEAGDLQGAVVHYAQAAALDPANASYAFGQGLAALRMLELRTAEGALREAVRRDPTFAQAVKALGVALLEQGRRDEALTYMRRALELDPGMTDAPRMRALLEEQPVGPPR